MSALAERIKRRKQEIKALKKNYVSVRRQPVKQVCKWCTKEIMEIDGQWIHIETKFHHCDPNFDDMTNRNNKVAEPKELVC